MTEVILILGGTKEAAELADGLSRRKPHARIISSLAGRTKEPKPLAGEVRTGGFGGAEGLAEYITKNSVTSLIDATHPFAKNISKNAKQAANITGVDLEVRERQAWRRKDGDNWIEVQSLDEAIQAIPQNARVLLALGSQYISPFSIRKDVHFLVRMVDKPEEALEFTSVTLEIGKPGNIKAETTLLKQHAITHIVCRNSGGEGAYAKIEAARLLGLPVIILEMTK